MVTYPVQRNLHRDGILAMTEVFDGNLAPELAESALHAARAVAQELQYVGVLCVEFFVVAQDGAEVLLVNEIATASTMPPATRAALRNAWRGSAIASAAAVPSTGVMSGASNMAPITTATESAKSPNAATTTDSVIITAKSRFHPGGGCNAIFAMIRRRCSGSTCGNFTTGPVQTFGQPWGQIGERMVSPARA